MPTFTLRPSSVDGIDTYLRQAAPDAASGTATGLELRSKASGAARYSLLKFDLSPLIGATVLSATLTLTESGTGAASDYNFSVHAISAANFGWDELSTWNYKTPSTVRWAGDAASDGGTDAGCSVSGVDYNAVPMGTLAATTPHTTDEKYNIALNVAQFQAMIAANYGMVLVIAEDVLEVLYSSNHATESRRPLLTVEYVAVHSMIRAPFWGRF